VDKKDFLCIETKYKQDMIEWIQIGISLYITTPLSKIKSAVGNFKNNRIDCILMIIISMH